MPSFPISIDPSSPFSLENLPFGIFTTTSSQNRRACTAIGDYVLDLAVLEDKAVFSESLKEAGDVFSQPNLNRFAALPKQTRNRVREAIAAVLSNAASILFADDSINQAAFLKQSEVQMHLPMEFPEFTDYSCYEEHVNNAANMTGTKVPPSFYCFPLAYNGRVSSLVSHQTDIPRPRGMYRNSEGKPELQSCAMLDYELEMGIIVSKPVPWGQTITPDQAIAEHVFGLVLVNDWSARDIQGFESVPLGPFNAKAFATSVGPWVVVPEALGAAATVPINQKLRDPPPHMQHQSLQGTIYDVEIACSLARNGSESKPLSLTNFAHSYFSVGQILTHRASSGCGLRTGELVAGGTMSSPEAHRPSKDLCHHGCLWELSRNGKVQVPIVGGTFLEDGDVVRFEASAPGRDGRRIGFGSITAKILPTS